MLGIDRVFELGIGSNYLKKIHSISTYTVRYRKKLLSEQMSVNSYIIQHAIKHYYQVILLSCHISIR